MKLSDYAKKVGVKYRTAWRWYKTGKIKGYQMETGTIIITEGEDEPRPQKVAIYARVPANDMQANLARQADRLIDYCAAKGWQVHQVIKEVGGGVNDNRRKLTELLRDRSVTIIVVEHEDRLTPFGFDYIETLLKGQGRRIEVVSLAENEAEDLLPDLVSIIDTFCTRLYGPRRAKRKIERITAELQKDD